MSEFLYSLRTIYRRSTFFAAAAFLAATLPATSETREILTYDAVAKGVSACVTLASENDWNMSITVVDRGDNPLATTRMTESLPFTYTASGLKASSALAWGMPTADIETYIADKPQFRALPGLLTVGGGLPITSTDGVLIGAIGVVGSSVENDAACAQVAIDAMHAN